MIETVLGKAAMYLNARIPEIQSVSVSSSKELDDFEDVIDEYTGEVVFRFVHILLCCVMVYPIFNKVLIIQNNIIRCKRDSQYIILVSSSSVCINFTGKKERTNVHLTLMVTGKPWSIRDWIQTPEDHSC